jgi:hypothetical protein
MDALGQFYFLGMCAFAIVFGLALLAIGFTIWKLPHRSRSRLGFLGYLGVAGISLFKGLAQLWSSIPSSTPTSSIHRAIAITIAPPLLYLIGLDQWQRRAPVASPAKSSREDKILTSVVRIYLILGIVFVGSGLALQFYRKDLAAIFRVFPFCWSLPWSLLTFTALREVPAPIIYSIGIFLNASLYALVFLNNAGPISALSTKPTKVPNSGFDKKFPARFSLISPKRILLVFLFAFLGLLAWKMTGWANYKLVPPLALTLRLILFAVLFGMAYVLIRHSDDNPPT